MSTQGLSPTFLPTVAFAILVAAAALQVIWMLRRDRKPDPASPHLLAIAGLLLLADIVRRSVQIRFLAITGLFESLVFFAGVVAVVLAVYRYLSGPKTLPYVSFGATLAAIFLLAVASAPIAPKEVAPPVPALQSNWLALHVSFSFIGESFFVVAFVTSIVYLASREPERRARLDRLTYTATIIGYPIFTVGALIFGAIWADVAWGAYWSWDPKETWALVTWLAYTGYLHSRLVGKWRGAVSAAISIVAFVLTLFTLFGVNFLISGLHSYR
jgi:ABC-type transport system involved in cytochrome c biogenesis permease subunit